MAKFVRRSKAVKEEAPVVELEDFDVEALVAEAKKMKIDGVFIPKEENSSMVEVNAWIPMNRLITDITGTPGLPCGMITMVYGKKDSGKTTFAIEALVNAQKEKGVAILIDTENKFSVARAVTMGLDRNKLVWIKAGSIEEAFDKFIQMIDLIKKPGRKERKIVCVWDSLGATPSDAELDETKTDFAMTAAKVIKGRLRKLVRYLHDTNVAFLIINQVYTKPVSFGKQTAPYGGSGPEYHSALILEFVNVGRVRPPGGKAGSPFCGTRTRIECVKNHLAPPFRFAEVAIDGRGFVVDRHAEYEKSAEEVPGKEEE